MQKTIDLFRSWFFLLSGVKNLCSVLSYGVDWSFSQIFSWRKGKLLGFERGLVYTVFLIIAFVSKAYAADKITVSAEFEPKELALGRRGLLNVTVSGSKNASAPIIPEIDGLVIRGLGTQQNIQVINGVASVSSTYSFSVSGQRAGEYRLPDFDWDINGQKYLVSSATAKLRVLEQGSSGEGETGMAIDLKVNIRKDKVFVGQMIPVTVALYAPTTILGQVSVLPAIEGDDFISYGYREPLREVVESSNGAKKQVISYETYITPLKAGANSLQYKMGLVIQTPHSMSPNRASANNFFESIFGNLAINNIEEVEPISVPERINVSVLPIHGKPENFTGAIGEFSIETLTVTPEEGHVGDPITLKLVVKGAGNMDRISAPVLKDGENWKVYTPKSTFNKEDAFGFRGTKIFEYIIIPQNDRITETPPITFSFFNPEKERYYELTPNPVGLRISPVPNSVNQSNVDPLINNQNIAKTTLEGSELLPIKLGIKKSVRTLRPLMTKAFFTPLIIGMAIAVGGVLVFIKRRKLRHDQDTEYLKQVNTEKVIQENLEKVRKAYGKGDAREFYHAASTVILEIVARQHGKTAQALNVEDVESFFREKKLSEEFISFIKTILNTDDVIRFSGASDAKRLSSESLKDFESLINELEKCC